VLGALASLVALALSRSLKLTHHLVEAIPAPPWIKLLGGGAILGLTSQFLPEAIGIGYETIESLLQNSPFSVSLLALILGAKLLLTPLSLASGFVGGIFAPALFLGAVLGSLYGKLIPHLLPTADPPAYALVGMAALLAGTVRAPLTAVLLLFEMTRDYRIVLPLMAAVGLCSWLTAQIQLPQSRVFNLGLQFNDSPENLEVLAQIRVADVMTLNPPTVQHTQSLLRATQIMTSGYHHSVVVVDQHNCLTGILTNQDVKRILANPQWSDRLEEIKVGEVCTPEVLHTYADESVVDALKRMAVRDLRQLPVVDRHLQKRVVAIVDKVAIATAYESALTKSAIAEQIKIPLEKTVSTGDNYPRADNSPHRNAVVLNSVEL
jgi:CBS domain-containing protein